MTASALNQDPNISKGSKERLLKLFHQKPQGFVCWFKQNFIRDKLKDTVNYCVLINKLLELMGDELIQLGEKNMTTPPPQKKNKKKPQQPTNVRRKNNFHLAFCVLCWNMCTSAWWL